jgi:hypothetical protein
MSSTGSLTRWPAILDFPADPAVSIKRGNLLIWNSPPGNVTLATGSRDNVVAISLSDSDPVSGLVTCYLSAAVVELVVTPGQSITVFDPIYSDENGSCSNRALFGQPLGLAVTPSDVDSEGITRVQCALMSRAAFNN